MTLREELLGIGISEKLLDRDWAIELMKLLSVLKDFNHMKVAILIEFAPNIIPKKQPATAILTWIGILCRESGGHVKYSYKNGQNYMSDTLKGILLPYMQEDERWTQVNATLAQFYWERAIYDDEQDRDEAVILYISHALMAGMSFPHFPTDPSAENEAFAQLYWQRALASSDFRLINVIRYIAHKTWTSIPPNLIIL